MCNELLHWSMKFQDDSLYSLEDMAWTKSGGTDRRTTVYSAPFFLGGGGYNEGTTLSWALALHCEYKNATYNRCIVIDTIMVRHFNITALHCVADNLYT